MKKYFCDFQVWCIRIIWSPYTYTYIQKRTYPISQGFLLVLLMCTWTFYLSLYMSKQKHYFANKGLSSQGYGFSSGHVWLWELDWEESWAPKNWCFWTVVLDKTESPLDCKEIILKEISPGCSLEGLMPPHAKSCLLEKTLMLGGIGGRRRRGRQRMRWHLDAITDLMDRHEFE